MVKQQKENSCLRASHWNQVSEHTSSLPVHQRQVGDRQQHFDHCYVIVCQVTDTVVQWRTSNAGNCAVDTSREAFGEKTVQLDALESWVLG